VYLQTLIYEYIIKQFAKEKQEYIIKHQVIKSTVEGVGTGD
jgi:hypothetical protein